MMTTSSSSHQANSPTNDSINPQDPITYTAWKLYDNPFYTHQYRHCQYHKHSRDLIIFKQSMDDEMQSARTQIIRLMNELEYERKARKKAESVNKRLARELAEERRGREALERVCEELARQASCSRLETDRMKKELDEERKMMRMAAVLREERVQMKLTEARILLEEKLSQFDQDREDNRETTEAPDLSGKLGRLDLRENSTYNENSRIVSSMTIQRRTSPEPENPHIMRGIKGFVEFPRVVRSIGSKNRNWSSKLECQKAQLRILLKHKTHIRSVV